MPGQVLDRTWKPEHIVDARGDSLFTPGRGSSWSARGLRAGFAALVSEYGILRRAEFKDSCPAGATQTDVMMPIFTKPRRSAQTLLFALTLAIGLSACGSDRLEREQLNSADVIYERAQRSMNNGNYREAIFVFEQLESRYPFSQVGKQSQLDLIYCYYKSGSQEQAVDAADQFMRENPTHPRVDYALYIKALTYFDRPPGPLDTWFDVDRSERPPNDARRSFSVLRQLVERYPASDYSEDAVQRMRYIKDKLANYENGVADYYLRRGAWIAALNRAKSSLETYDGTTANKRSLEIMIDAYEGLGLDDLAASTREVLTINFPDS